MAELEHNDLSIFEQSIWAKRTCRLKVVNLKLTNITIQQLSSIFTLETRTSRVRTIILDTDLVMQVDPKIIEHSKFIFQQQTCPNYKLIKNKCLSLLFITQISNKINQLTESNLLKELFKLCYTCKGLHYERGWEAETGLLVVHIVWLVSQNISLRRWSSLLPFCTHVSNDTYWYLTPEDWKS